MKRATSTINYSIFLSVTLLIAVIAPIIPALLPRSFVDGGNTGFLFIFSLSIVWLVLLIAGLAIYGRSALWALFGAPFVLLWPIVILVGPYVFGTS